MTRSPAAGRRPLDERLTAATAGHTDVDALAQAVFATIEAEVPFAFACLATVDPVSGLINAAYKSHPLPVGDEEFAASEYGGPDLNQFVEIAQRPVPVGALSLDTGGDPARCRRLREFMTPRFGFSDELRLVCRGPRTVWGLLGLYRGQGEPPFTAADVGLLGPVHQVVADGLRRAVFTEPSATGGATGTPVVLIVGPDDRVTDMSTATDAVVDDLGGWDHGSLPASVLMVTASCRSRRGVAEAHVPTRSGGWLRVRAVPLGEASVGTTLAVTIDPADPATIGQLMIAARGLTVREQEIVALVLQGASTKEIAGTLFLSPHTVQDHLKAVFTKLGVSSRRELVGQFVLT